MDGYQIKEFRYSEYDEKYNEKELLGFNTKQKPYSAVLDDFNKYAYNFLNRLQQGKEKFKFDLREITLEEFNAIKPLEKGKTYNPENKYPIGKATPEKQLEGAFLSRFLGNNIRPMLFYLNSNSELDLKKLTKMAKQDKDVEINLTVSSAYLKDWHKIYSEMSEKLINNELKFNHLKELEKLYKSKELL